MKQRNMLSSVVSMTLVSLVLVPMAIADNWVGSKSQVSYEREWLTSSSQRDKLCGAFVNEMDSYSGTTRKYWTDIKGAKWRYLEGSGEGYGYGIDNVDIYLNCSHGWISGNVFEIAMWNQDDTVLSDQMRLGDDGRQLSIYSSYDCGQMNPSAGWGTRWSYLFDGGLRYASAFWGKSWNSASNTWMGRLYAGYLENGFYLRAAWLNSMDDYSGNTPAVMATGITASNCMERLSEMSFHDYRTYNRLRDNNVKYFCMTRRE